MSVEAQPVYAKWATPGEPIQDDEAVIALRACPECEGRGWFLINPFATGGSNGVGGIRNMTQCRRCYDAHEYYMQHGKLPEESEAQQ